VGSASIEAAAGGDDVPVFGAVAGRNSPATGEQHSAGSSQFFVAGARRRDPQTIGQTLEKQNGFGAGFDVLRWVLAFAIFYGHCKWLAGSNLPKVPGDVLSTLVERGWAGFRRPFQVSLVPMFFSLSGFLVTASALRVRDVKTFVTLRSLRIFPALTVEVVLSALILGPMLTALTLGAYVTDRSFLSYFGNILGIVQFQLPGVFAANPIANVVNANLWTLPGEFYCYLISALAMWTGLMFNRKIFTLLFAVITVASIVASLTAGYGMSETTVSTPVLVYYFFTGCLFYQWRDTIPRDSRIFAAAVLLAYAMLYHRETVYLAPFALVYVTIYLGLFHHDKLAVLRKADYSYGIYLYGFPITQALLAVLPGLQGHGNWLVLAATPLTLCFAAFSWHVIEAPMLKLKSVVLGSRKSTVARIAEWPRSAQATVFAKAAG
jgi:peptidoglycan/LPS O-acetylase OafA/YrhL